jgi:hypothetical protein
LWIDPDHWSPWYFDGRSAISGWRSSPGSKQQEFNAIRIDPIVLAFGPGVERLPATSVKPIPPVEGWEGEFVHGVAISPPGVEEAIGWMLFRGIYELQHNLAEQFCDLFSLLAPSPSGFTHHRLIMRRLGNLRPPVPEAMDAIPFLSIRAARRAIAADPNNPDTYYALYLALQNPELPIQEGERIIAQITALRQCLYRMPPPKLFRRNIYLASPHMIASTLSVLYNIHPPQKAYGVPLDLPALTILLESPLSSDGVWGVGEDRRGLFPIHWRDKDSVQRVSRPNIRAVDLAREMMLLAIEYAEIELSQENREFLEKELEEMKTRAKKLSDELAKNTQTFESEKLRQPKLPDQVRSALRHNLVGKALEILTDKGTDLKKEFGQAVAEIVLIRIALEMAVGRLEDAAADLELAPAVLEPTPLQPNVRQYLQNHMQNMKYQKLVFEGNYKEAGDLVGSMMGEHFGKDPPLTQSESAFKVSPAIVSWGFERTLTSFQLIPISPLAGLHRDRILLEVMLPFAQRQQTLLKVRNSNSNYFYQRGLLSLYEGDIQSAKKRFEQSRQPGVPEWGVPERQNSKAEYYLKLIVEAEKKAMK